MMRKNVKPVLCLLLATMMLSACGNAQQQIVAPEDTHNEPLIEAIPEEEEAKEEVILDEDGEAVIPEGMYLSELTGLPIDVSIKDQRPMAVMIDNEKTALAHYGTAEADVVYEMVNSTQNNRITRLMALVKDWEKIERMGSIRSTRPTNLILLGEWNAILCHDGGPQVHNETYYAKPYVDRFSGTFHRIQNGKPREFTEYVVSGDIESNFKSNSKISREYNEFKPKRDLHFHFAPYGEEVDLSEAYENSIECTLIDLSNVFPHNSSQLKYNQGTQMYEYYEYGERHDDAEDGEPLAFKNVFLQCATMNQLDANGYMIYNVIDNARLALYFTNGRYKGVTWVKSGETEITHFYDENGDEIEINAGKTYIGLVPDDTWDQIELH